ncbi:MAG: phospholipid carrier-dependent glycosyltransferase [Acidobacteriota bacterium]|nr:phospholipid carrier-dependent glycosyltransferase [Acidobacteriota bacterium]
MAVHRRWRLARLLPLLLPLLLLEWTGLVGIDYGSHWDEQATISGARASIEQGGTLLPFSYTWPSMAYWLAMAAVVPDAQAIPMSMGAPVHDLKGRLLAALATHAYLLRLRALFLSVSVFAVVWVYLLVLCWRRSWVQALLAASLLALSWEVAYHLRFAVPDGVMMQWAALTLLLLVTGELRRPHGWPWLIGAALTAGFTVSTKYSAWPLVLPVLAAVWLAEDGAGSERRFRRVLGTGLVAIGGYLLITPGTLMQPVLFLVDVRWQIHHYASGHGVYTVAAGPPHLARQLLYLSAVLFSRNAVIAAALFALAVAGAVALWHESRRLALLVLAFPVTYVLYLACQRVMIVRNLLVVAPWLAVLAAIGAAALTARLPGRALKAGAAVALVAAMGFNAVQLVQAAHSIEVRGTDAAIGELEAYVRERPSTHFFVTAQVASRIPGGAAALGANIVSDPASADAAVFNALEGLPKDTPANSFRLLQRWFGPQEINLDYYPDWTGNDHIVVMSMTRARRLGVRLQ